MIEKFLPGDILPLFSRDYPTEPFGNCTNCARMKGCRPMMRMMIFNAGKPRRFTKPGEPITKRYDFEYNKCLHNNKRCRFTIINQEV